MASSKTDLVEDVLISNVTVDTRIYAGNWWGNGEAICLMAVFHHLPAYDLPVPDRRFPVNIRRIRMNNIQCSSENALAIIGEGMNIKDIALTGLSVRLKASCNKPIKGNRIDLSPSDAECVLPDDQPVWLVMRQASRIVISGYDVAPFEGADPGIVEQCCEDIKY